MTTYSTSLRLWEGTPGDPAIKNAWGTFLNTNDNLIESAMLGEVAVPIGGLATWTLTTANGAADQARPLIQNYTGALTANCTVTLPNVPKVGWAVNNTTGGYSVILTAGAGTTVTIPPGGAYWWFQADGSTNVTLPAEGIPQAAAASTSPLRADQAWQEIATYAAAGVAAQAFPLSSAFRRFRLTCQNLTVGTNAAVLALQLSSNGGVSYNTSGYNYCTTTIDSTGATTTAVSIAAAGILLTGEMISPASGNNWDTTVEIWPGSAAALPRVRGSAYGVNSANAYQMTGIGGGWNGTLALMNYAQVLASTGTFSGTLVLEGLP
jgi:hypothetical protein